MVKCKKCDFCEKYTHNQHDHMMRSYDEGGHNGWICARMCDNRYTTNKLVKIVNISVMYALFIYVAIQVIKDVSKDLRLSVNFVIINLMVNV